MWRLYLEVGILVVIAFGIGALVAMLVVRRLVKDAAPGDELGQVGPGSPSAGPGAGTSTGAAS